MKSFKTHKGTELPLLNLRGKDYLETKNRVVWFREDHPDWSIETEIVRVDEKSCLSKAVIKDASGRIVSMSHKFEDLKGFNDFIEKSETGAIGRALALCGYGTQFCADELNEGERIVDSPGELPKKAPPAMADIPTAKLPNLADKIQRKKEVAIAHKNAAPYPEPKKDQPTDSVEERDRLGEYVIPVTKKLKGKKLKEVTVYELQNTLKWFDENATKPLHNDTLDFYEKASAYLDLCEVRR